MSEEKYEKLYYRIGEVAEMFNVNTSLIRYWESEFSVLRPRKSTKGNRMFTQRDLRYLRMIYQLVKVQGYTLQGAKDALKKDFDQLERKTTVLMTLEKTKEFWKKRLPVHKTTRQQGRNIIFFTRKGAKKPVETRQCDML